MRTFLTIAGDQHVIAALALMLFSIFILFAYIAHQERKSRREPYEIEDWWIP